MDKRIDNVSEGNSKSGVQPIIYAALLIVGIFVGTNLGDDSSFKVGSPDGTDPNVLVNVINAVNERYVDSVERKVLVEGAIESLLEDLDPHSYYISSEELQSMQEPLEGNFEGIGVEFIVQRDTLMVVTPIVGGPSEAAGIAPGDKIVRVDGEEISGEGLDSRKVMEVLKGRKGTNVILSIQRRGQDDLLEFNITRDRIPIYSVVADFMVEEEIGYVKVTRFARNTYEEFTEAVNKMQNQGATKLVVDLRGNGGGYLRAATSMIEEFLGRDKLVVYTEGEHSRREEFYSRNDGRYKNMDVVVLINQASASASEIMAGALQDHDRSITVGRRSFGKGLVQEEIELPDGSVLRLTVSRYYTPTGRSIQKPYGDGVDYENDYYSRLESGELTSRDSIQNVDSLKYVTPAGKIVYGGGGITPDIFVPLDTMSNTWYYSDLSYSGGFRQFAFDFVQTSRSYFDEFDSPEKFIREFEPNDALMEKLFEFGEELDVPRDENEIEQSYKSMQNRLKARLAKNLFGENEYYRVLLDDDPEFQKGLEAIRDYERFSKISE